MSETHQSQCDVSHSWFGWANPTTTLLARGGEGRGGKRTTEAKEDFQSWMEDSNLGFIFSKDRGLHLVVWSQS